MGRKYIKEQIYQDFVYPNNSVSQYDTEIVHVINNNSITGDINNVTITGLTSSGATITFDWEWFSNGAEPWINDAGQQVLLSVHMMDPSQSYFKPWRTVYYVTTGVTGNTSYSGTSSFTLTPSALGLNSLSSGGTFYSEYRMIGHRSTYPICYNLNATGITPTPTPSPTPTPTITPTVTPTPTITPSTGCTSDWTIRNANCGGGTINDIGINGSFIGTLSGPSNFPLTSTLYGYKTNPNGVLCGTGNTIQANVTTNLPGVGNCAILRVIINGVTPTPYETYFDSNPFPQVSGVIINSGDTVEVEVDCFLGPCPP